MLRIVAALSSAEIENWMIAVAVLFTMAVLMSR